MAYNKVVLDNRSAGNLRKKMTDFWACMRNGCLKTPSCLGLTTKLPAVNQARILIATLESVALKNIICIPAAACERPCRRAADLSLGWTQSKGVRLAHCSAAVLHCHASVSSGGAIGKICFKAAVFCHTVFGVLKDVLLTWAEPRIIALKAYVVTFPAFVFWQTRTPILAN